MANDVHAFGKGLITVGVIKVVMTIDQVAHGLVADDLQRSQQSFGSSRRHVGIHHQHIGLSDQH